MKFLRDIQAQIRQPVGLFSAVFAFFASLGVYIYLLQSITVLKLSIFIFALFIFLFFATLLFAQRFLVPTWKKFKNDQRFFILLFSLAVAGLLIPGLAIPPIHFLEIQHSVEITVLPETNPASQGSAVELFGFNSGENWESFEKFAKQGEWVRGPDYFLTESSPASLAWKGSISEEARLVFVCRPDGAKIRIAWDDRDQQILDLYCPVRSQIQANYPVAAPRVDWSRLLASFIISLDIALFAFVVLLLLSRFLIKKSGSNIPQRPIDYVSTLPAIRKNTLFITLCLFIAYLQIGNYQGRLATIYTDDAPPVYSYLFTYPERFSHDLISTFGVEQTFATIENWLPALMYRYLSIPPEIPTLIFILAQFVLLGFAVLRFTKLITGNETVGWLTVFFIFGANPWEWNMANYGNVMYMAYAGHLVMPFIFFAFSDILEERNLRAMLWLFIAGLIHPTLVLYAIGMIGIYWGVKYRFRVNITHWILLCLVALSATLPRFLLLSQFGNGDLLSFKEMEYAFRNNLHAHPIFMTPRVLYFLFFQPLIFLSLREKLKVLPKYFYLLFSVFVGCVILVLSSNIGWQYEILYLIQLIPQRSTTLLIFISLPLVINYLYQNLTDRPLFVGLLTLCFFTVFTVMNGNFLTMPGVGFWLLALLLPDLLNGDFGPFSWRSENSVYNESQYPVDIHSNRNVSAIFGTFTLVAVLCITAYNSWMIGAPGRSSEALANYEIQVWARDHLPENVMVMGMGRSISQHPSLDTLAYNLYIYNRSRITKEYVDHVLTYNESFYRKTGLDMKVDNMNEEWIKRVAADFGASFVLRKTSKPLEFEEAYRNDLFVLYKIPAS